MLSYISEVQDMTHPYLVTEKIQYILPFVTQLMRRKKYLIEKRYTLLLEKVCNALVMSQTHWNYKITPYFGGNASCHECVIKLYLVEISKVLVELCLHKSLKVSKTR